MARAVDADIASVATRSAAGTGAVRQCGGALKRGGPCRVECRCRGFRRSCRSRAVGLVPRPAPPSGSRHRRAIWLGHWSYVYERSSRHIAGAVPRRARTRGSMTKVQTVCCQSGLAGRLARSNHTALAVAPARCTAASTLSRIASVRASWRKHSATAPASPRMTRACTAVSAPGSVTRRSRLTGSLTSGRRAAPRNALGRRPDPDTGSGAWRSGTHATSSRRRSPPPARARRAAPVRWWRRVPKQRAGEGRAGPARRCRCRRDARVAPDQQEIRVEGVERGAQPFQGALAVRGRRLAFLMRGPLHLHRLRQFAGFLAADGRRGLSSVRWKMPAIRASLPTSSGEWVTPNRISAIGLPPLSRNVAAEVRPGGGG